MAKSEAELLTVEEAARQLGVSASTVWRMIRGGRMRSLRRGGRRLIPRDALRARLPTRRPTGPRPFTPENPMFRLAGAFRSGGSGPGSADKHAILDE